jgi:hypothetical protein
MFHTGVMGRLQRFLLWEPRWMKRAEQRWAREAAFREVPGVPGMPIEVFYASDERRRNSEEQQVGEALWLDKAGNTWEPWWVIATGDLYVLWIPPVPTALGDPWNGGTITITSGGAKQAMIRPLGRVAPVQELDTRLPGWRTRATQLGGVEAVQAVLDPIDPAIFYWRPDD